MLIALSGVMLLTALLRLIPGTLWPRSGSDAGYHMLLRREIRRHRMRIPARLETLALDERQTYPWFYHWLLAFIPERTLDCLPGLPSAVIDALHSGLVVLLAAWLVPLARPDLDPVTSGLLAGLLFGTSPALLAVGIGPRSYEITPRPLGELLFSVLLCAAGIFAVTGTMWALVLAVTAGALILLSSKFAAQVMIFCLPLIALITAKWSLLGVLPASLLGALLLSKGRYWWVLTAQLAHLSFYCRRTQYEHPGVRNRNDLRALWHKSIKAHQSGFREWAVLKDLMATLGNNTFFQFIIRNTLFIGVVVLAGFGVFHGWADSARVYKHWLWAWGLAPLAPFFLTSLEGWRFLGEAERYPEYGLAPVCVLAAVGVLGLSQGSAMVLLAVYLISLVPIWVYTLFRMIPRLPRKERAAALEQLVKYLRQVPAGTLILPIPVNLGFELSPKSEVRFVITLDPFVLARDYEECYHKFPWPSGDLDKWQKKHGVQLVVTEPTLFNPHADWLSPPEYQLDRLELLFENRSFKVFAFKGGNI